MSLTKLYRASGLALILSSVLGLIGNTLDNMLAYNSDPHQYLTALWIIVELVAFVGTALFLLALPAVLVRYTPRTNWLGLLGFTLTFVGNLLYLGYYVIALIDLPWLAQVAPNLAANYGPASYILLLQVAAVTYGLGGIFFGIAILRAASLPRLVSVLLIIGAVVNLGTLLPISSLAIAIFSIVAFVPYAIAFGWIGYALMLAKSTEKVQSTTPSFAIGD